MQLSAFEGVLQCYCPTVLECYSVFRQLPDEVMACWCAGVSIRLTLTLNRNLTLIFSGFSLLRLGGLGADFTLHFVRQQPDCM